jgi:hypothetical protein
MQDVYGESMQENFKAGKMDLDSGTVNLSSSDAKLLNDLFSDLNPKNKKEFTAELMKDKSGFNEIISFAREAS